MDGTTARAMMLVEPRHFSLTELPASPDLSGGWLAVEATGISGADVQVWKGEAKDVVYPLIPGHEVVGRIARTAPTIPYPVGTRVVVEPRIHCGECHRCKLNLATCARRRPSNSYGFIPSIEPPGLWGGLAEFLYIDPAARLHQLTDDVPAEVGTFVHPLAAGHTWAVELPSLQEGENVLILGPGPRGLACLIAAKAAGAGWVGVTGLSHDRDRLELAKRLGADLAIDAEREDVGGAIAEAIGTRPDIVLDVTSDDPEALFTALDLVREGYGHAVLPLSTLRAYAGGNAGGNAGGEASFTLRPIIKPRLSIQVSLVTSAQRPATPLTQHVLALIPEIAAKVLAAP